MENNDVTDHIGFKSMNDWSETYVKSRLRVWATLCTEGITVGVNSGVRSELGLKIQNVIIVVAAERPGFGVGM